MVFMTTQMPAMNMAFPDVCLTPIPTPAGPVPIPIPYPNMSMTAMAIPAQFKCFGVFMPSHNMMSIAPMTMGDNGGLNMNPLSGMVMGPQKQLLGSIKVITGGLPQNKMLGLSGQNGMSPGSFGATLSPSQPKIIVLG
jgi:hypothetical protein